MRTRGMRLWGLQAAEYADEQDEWDEQVASRTRDLVYEQDEWDEQVASRAMHGRGR